MNIIAIVGQAGSGKSTVASILEDEIRANFGRVYQVSFAEPMKRFTRELFNFDDTQLYGPSEEREKPDERYVKADGTLLTPRFALQTLGDWGRMCWPEVWCERAIKHAVEMLTSANSIYTHAIVPDCRYPNEARIVRKYIGHVWRIKRPGADGNTSGGIQGHTSERYQFSKEMDEQVTVDILNDGSLSDLRRKVQEAMEKAVARR